MSRCWGEDCVFCSSWVKMLWFWCGFVIFLSVWSVEEYGVLKFPTIIVLVSISSFRTNNSLLCISGWSCVKCTYFMIYLLIWNFLQDFLWSWSDGNDFSWFCLSGMYLNSPSFLKSVFTGYNILNWKFYSFTALNISSHSLWACSISHETSAVSLIGFLLYVI